MGKVMSDKQNKPQSKGERNQSEYQANIESKAPKRGSGKPGGGRKESAADIEGRKIQARKDREDTERPEMFKMQKFKAVKSKTDTGRVALGPNGIPVGAN